MTEDTTSRRRGVHPADATVGGDTGRCECCRLCQQAAEAERRTQVDASAIDASAHGAADDRATADDHDGEVADHDTRRQSTDTAEGGGHGGGRDGGDHGEDTSHADHERLFRRRFWVSLVLSVPVLVFSEFVQDTLGYTAPTFPGSVWVTPALSVVVFAYGGVPFLSMAQTELRTRDPGMMTLISLAITVAFTYSLVSVVLPGTTPFFWELVTLIDVMLLGHWIEMRSVRRASGALDELARLVPDTAERVTEDGATESVPVADLATDDVVLVRPGTSVPADGTVVEGTSSVDESMITGESRPVEKDPGAEVIAGTINQDGSLRVQVTKTGEETALAGIMRLVEEAQQSKSRTQLLADRAAGWLFYVALSVAAVTAVAWVFVSGPTVTALERVVTVLVIACPHALGLAVPLVIAINTSTAAENGILVRDRIAMEDARGLDWVMFDKTGTLTRGEQGVVGTETIEGYDDERALAVAAGVERDSEHMIARALRAAAEERGVSPVAASSFENIRGVGVTALVDGERVHLGGPNLLTRLGVEQPGTIADFADEAGTDAQTVVYLVRGESTVVAAFALADVVREESRRAVEALHEMGIEVAMLTGDSEAVARAVADELEIDQYFAEVLPEEKDTAVAQLQAEGNRVAMVGDGVNDAPALARADVGIAIGSGTDVAIEAGDVVLVDNDPLDVVRLIRLSRASYRKMQENLVWASGYNVVALPVAAGVLAPVGVLLSPAVGAVFMSLSTIIVAINARRLGGIDLSI